MTEVFKFKTTSCKFPENFEQVSVSLVAAGIRAELVLWEREDANIPPFYPSLPRKT